MAHFLVTGGCGFIGSHLVDSLIADGHTVAVLDNLSTGSRANLHPQARLFEADLADRASVAAAMQGADGCFHLAAVASVTRSIEDWAGTHRSNLTGAIHVFEAARDAGRVPVVYASSAAVYGNAVETPIRETTPTAPLSAYGADKLGCELHARVAWLQFGIPTTGLRFFNVYGPRQDPKSPYSGVISIFAERLASDQPITIDGDGGQVRDFIEVGDVVHHLRRAMATCDRDARILNVCTGRPTAIGDLARLIATAVGAVATPRFGPARAGDIRHSLGDPTRAQAALDIASTLPIEAGLRRLVEWSAR